MYIVRALHRSRDGDALFSAVFPYHTVVLYIELLGSSGKVLAFDNKICLVTNRVDVTLYNVDLFDHIVFAPDQRVLVQGVLDSQASGLFRVLNRDILSCLADKIDIGVGDQEDGLLGVIHSFLSKNRLLSQEHFCRIFTRDVVGCHNCELVPRDVSTISYFPYFTPGDGASDRCTVKHVGQYNVVHITA